MTISYKLNESHQPVIGLKGCDLAQTVHLAGQDGDATIEVPTARPEH